MKSIREWVFSQLLTKSLAPSILLSGGNRFSPEEQTDDGIDDQDSTHAPNLDVSAVQSDRSPSPNQTQEAQDHLFRSGSDMSKLDPLSKIDDLQIKFLRLLKRLGHSYDNLLVAKVLYRMNLATLIRAGEADSRILRLRHDRARAIAAKEEAAGYPELNYSFRVLLLGRTGVGKSATINSILGQVKTVTDAFRPATDRIREVSGTVGGMKISFIDTPGFLPPSASNLRRNRKIMLSVRKYIRRSPPDIVLFFERLDDINMIYSDFPLLKLMSEVFGNGIWFNMILVMTHASCLLPEGPHGYSVMYESQVSQCIDLIQQYIHQAVSDSKLENLALLVENHPQCKRNSRGEKILPNGQAWISQFLLLCLCTKVLNDANNLLGFRESIVLGPTNTRQPSLPHLLSSLLRNHSGPSVSDVPGVEEEITDILLSETDDEDEYSQLPPIKILTGSQFDKLTKSQKRDYLDELDYRETLYLKKQLKEELQMKREEMLSRDESSEAPGEPSPLPDMAIPPTFDSDCVLHRYRGLVTSDQVVARPVLDPHGWDHDVGFDGVNLETSVEVKRNVFASVAGQLSTDKNNFSVHSESALAYTGIGGPCYRVGLDVQSAGKDLICTLKGATKLRPLKHNVAELGVSLTSFGSKHYTGAMIEDQIYVGKRLKFLMNAGRLEGGGKVAYGGNLEATLRGRDYPVRKDHVSLTMTVLSFDKDMVISAGLESEFRLSRDTTVSISGNLNNRKMGKFCIKTGSSEHLEIALIALMSIFRGLFRRKTLGNTSEESG